MSYSNVSKINTGAYAVGYTESRCCGCGRPQREVISCAGTASFILSNYRKTSGWERGRETLSYISLVS